MNKKKLIPDEVCPLCGGTLEARHDRQTTYRYLGKQHVLKDQEHTVCTGCGTSFSMEGQIARNKEKFLAWADTFIKHIAPWEILELREKYDLSQAQANQIFHCGPTQFSKWERGEVAPTGTAALALLEALENPEYMKKLARRAGVTIHIASEAKPTPVAAVAGKDLWRGIYASMVRVPAHGLETPSPAAVELLAWGLRAHKVAEPSVHTHLLFYDAAATHKRPVSRLFMTTHGRPDSYAILKGAPDETADELDDWLTAEANVPLVRGAKTQAKKTIKPTPAKGAR